MYQLRVMKAGEEPPRETIDLARAGEILAMIPVLIETHVGCERIVVFYDGVRLFSVDCTEPK